MVFLLFVCSLPPDAARCSEHAAMAAERGFNFNDVALLQGRFWR
jgi:hypothetical protein